MYGRARRGFNLLQAQSFFRFFLQLHKLLISMRWSLYYELSRFRSSIVFVHHLSYIYSRSGCSSDWFIILQIDRIYQFGFVSWYTTRTAPLWAVTQCVCHFALFVVANIVVCISGHKWRLSIPSPYLHPHRLVYVNIHVKEWDDKTRHSDGTNAFEHHKVIKLAKCGQMRALGHRIKNLKMKQSEVSTMMYHPHRHQKAGN